MAQVRVAVSQVRQTGKRRDFVQPVRFLSVSRECVPLSSCVLVSAAQKWSYKTLKMLLGVDSLEENKIPISYTYPQVTFAICKHLWVAGQTAVAYK